jgi:hypothetical protein
MMNAAHDNIKRDMVTKAMANKQLMDGAAGSIKEIIADNDVVFGVFPDADASFGFGMHLIKGRRLLAESMTGGGIIRVRASAILCDSAEIAQAAAQKFGLKELQ